MIRPVLTLVLASICLLASMASADDVQRLYVLDCGPNLGRDQARWSPGVNEGQAIEFSDNCYLIRHAKGLLLWDTGVPDAVATMPDGMVVANGAITYRRAKTLAYIVNSDGLDSAGRSSFGQFSVWRGSPGFCVTGRPSPVNCVNVDGRRTHFAS